MTQYGFDLDGTLDIPSIAKLANDLYDAGHDIYIITGGFSDSGEWTISEREKKLAKLGVQYTEIIRCLKPTFEEIGKEKGRVCKERKISLLFDDSDTYIQQSKGAVQCLKVI